MASELDVNSGGGGYELNPTRRNRDLFFPESSSNKFPWSLGSGAEHLCPLSSTLKIPWQFEITIRVGQTAAVWAKF